MEMDEIRKICEELNILETYEQWNTMKLSNEKFEEFCITQFQETRNPKYLVLIILNEGEYAVELYKRQH